MIKVLAILLALMMSLSCVGAMAEGASGTYGINPPLTRAQGYAMNEDAILALFDQAGLPESARDGFAALLAVMNNLGTRIVTAESGSQGQLFLKGNPVADFVLSADNGKICLATSLLPNYTLTISEETIVNVFEQVFELVLEEAMKNMDKLPEVIEKIAKAFEGVDFAALDKNYAAYAREAMAELLSSFTLGEAEAVDYVFENNGVVFNVKQTFEVDLKVFANAVANLINKKLNDENVPALVAAFNSLGLKIKLPGEVSTEALNAENVPQVKGAFYSIVDENGNPASNAQLVVVEISQEGKKENDAIRIYVSDVDCFVALEMPNDRTFITFTAAAVDENTANFNYSHVDDSGYYAVDGDIEYSEEGVVATTGLYVMDPDAPILVVYDTVTPGGELTLPLYSEGKTVVAVEELMQDKEGKIGASLAMDLICNGLSGLLSNTVNAMPDQIANLLNIPAPQAAE